MSAPHPSPMVKRCPSRWWFVVGAGLIVVSIAVGVTIFVTTLVRVTDEDATFDSADGPQMVSTPANEDRMIFVPQGEIGSGACVVTDGNGEGSERPVRPVFGTVTVTDGSTEWVAVGSFDSGDGNLVVDCTDAGSPQIRVGPALEVSTLLGSIAAVLLIPLLGGGAGLIVLIVVGILYASRPPRSQTG